MQNSKGSYLIFRLLLAKKIDTNNLPCEKILLMCDYLEPGRRTGECTCEVQLQYLGLLSLLSFTLLLVLSKQLPDGDWF